MMDDSSRSNQVEARVQVYASTDNGQALHYYDYSGLQSNRLHALFVEEDDETK